MELRRSPLLVAQASYRSRGKSQPFCMCWERHKCNVGGVRCLPYRFAAARNGILVLKTFSMEACASISIQFPVVAMALTVVQKPLNTVNYKFLLSTE